MTFILITGLILTIIPTVIIVTFMTIIFFSFMKDDKDATTVTRIALSVIASGILFLAWYFIDRIAN